MIEYHKKFRVCNTHGSVEKCLHFLFGKLEEKRTHAITCRQVGKSTENTSQESMFKKKWIGFFGFRI
jgi:hypothetical protein